MPYFIDNSHLENLTQLTRLHIPECTAESLCRILRTKPVLETLTIGPMSATEYLDRDFTEAFSLLPNPSRLTALRNDGFIQSDFYSKLGNLKEATMRDCKDFSLLTALQYVSTDLEQAVHLERNTNLTRLTLIPNRPAPQPILDKLTQVLPKLVNLRAIFVLVTGQQIEVTKYLSPQLTTLSMMAKTENFPNLTRLTNLEYLSIMRVIGADQQVDAAAEPFHDLTRLTHLCLYHPIQSNCHRYTSKLTNIKSLYLREDLVNFMTADVVTILTNLEELRLNNQRGFSLDLSAHTLEQPHCYHTILSHFVHLTRLQFHNTAPDLWHTLTKLTQLKALEMGSIADQDLHALTALQSLTELTVWQCMIDRDVFRQLTNLQKLSLYYELHEEYLRENKSYLYSLQRLARKNVL